MPASSHNLLGYTDLCNIFVCSLPLPLHCILGSSQHFHGRPKVIFSRLYLQAQNYDDSGLETINGNDYAAFGVQESLLTAARPAFGDVDRKPPSKRKVSGCDRKESVPHSFHVYEARL